METFLKTALCTRIYSRLLVLILNFGLLTRRPMGIAGLRAHSLRVGHMFRIGQGPRGSLLSV